MTDMNEHQLPISGINNCRAVRIGVTQLVSKVVVTS
jgi:hypothetical protein